MDAEALAVFERFEHFHNPNAANVARRRVIDDILRERLRARPDLPVVLLGAGFVAPFAVMEGVSMYLGRPFRRTGRRPCRAGGVDGVPDARATRDIGQRAVDFGSVAIPRWLLDTLLRSLRDGYQVHVFDALKRAG